MAVTRSEVAREAGVSPAVVSYVLNGGPRPVSGALRARVEAAVERLGYRPNAIAAALSMGSTHSVGLLTPNQSNAFDAGLVAAIERRLDEQGYLLLTANTHYDRAREERSRLSFLDRNVDALILMPGTSAVAFVGESAIRPVVAFEQNVPDGWSSINMDDEADSLVAVEHLQRHGRDLTGLVVGPPQISSEAKRLAGWRRQQRAAGFSAGDELIAYGELTEQGGNAAALQLLSVHGRPWAVHGRRPTALFVGSDTQAVGAVFACHELGMRVPEDVAIVSMGGTTAAAFTIPPLTSMRQDTEYIASHVVGHLVTRSRDPQIAPISESLRGNLVIGRSCGCDSGTY